MPLCLAVWWCAVWCLHSLANSSISGQAADIAGGTPHVRENRTAPESKSLELIFLHATEFGLSFVTCQASPIHAEGIYFSCPPRVSLLPTFPHPRVS